MAFIRYHIITTVIMLMLCINTRSQIIYYPLNASSLLRSTAQDAAELFGNAISGSNFSIQEFIVIPSSGIVFVYDSTISDNQLCKVESDGSNVLKFTAAEDNGLIFGFYRYLNELGFKFYLPGTIWQVTVALTSPYKVISKSYTSIYKYKSWFISGGHNRWAMDNNNNYGWDTYYGMNGHNWALYQRRNGMLGTYRFTGHRGDIMSGNYLTTLQNNPCYVACYNGSRSATAQSVPDVNNTAAMQLWSNTIEQKYSSFKNIIFGNIPLYADHYRNFNFFYNRIGIEVPDGSHWGNSNDNSGCSNYEYKNECDQNFILANFTAQKLNTVYPGKNLQLYAYSSHADVPSSSITINNNIDIQVVSSAFQNESSAKGLLNRWYHKSNNVSEYQYMNIPQWGGETPLFFLNDLKVTLKRLKDKNSQGILWEASPAKFASLPFLLAANENMLTQQEVDSSISNFCKNMFGPAAGSINKLLHKWSSDNTVTVGDFIPDNKYKLPLYFQMLNKAVLETQQSYEIIKQRIRELKAYLHYMVLYYDWLFDQRTNQAKISKAASVCLYLAKINKLQLVNSYFIISDIVSRYAPTDSFYTAYNSLNGTAYQNGNLPLITNAEIDADYLNDFNNIGLKIPEYNLLEAANIIDKINSLNVIPIDKINVKIGYTNGANYPNRAEFFINAVTAGSFTISYNPHFNLLSRGVINFTVEAADKALEIIKDFSLKSNTSAGQLIINLPHSGVYKLSVVSKYQSSVNLIINTNGHYFYKNTAFLGNKTENYRSDLASLPGFFYVPTGLQKVYFSINNSNSGGNGFSTPEQISTAFLFKDSYGNRVEPILASADDSSLFYIDIPLNQSGKFWQTFKMEQYNLCFANINNILVFARRKPCSKVDFKITVNNKNGNCLTHLSALSNTEMILKWEIYDSQRLMYYGNEKEIDLPDYVSPNSTVTLFGEENCISSKRIADEANYFKQKEACANGAPIPVINPALTIFPNPSLSVFFFNMNGISQNAEEIIIMNSQGSIVMKTKNINRVNLSFLPSGIYIYRLFIENKHYTGKLIKL